MVKRSRFKPLLAHCSMLALVALGGSSAFAQVGIEVVASAQRDGISVQNRRQKIGIADDGTIAFGATTPSGTDRMVIAPPGSTAIENGLSANNGLDVAINDTTVLYVSGSQVLAFRYDTLSAGPIVVQDCLDPATPCGGTRHVGMASDGYFAITAFDSYGGVYRGRIQSGRLTVPLASVPVLSGLISALGIDVRVGGPMLILGDHGAANAEVYGAFLSTPSRIGYFINTAVSTRPRGGNEGPWGASWGNYQTFALMPAQTDGANTIIAFPALVKGATQPYGTLQVTGTPVVPLLSVAGGSMDTNELGLAAVVATLQNGWAGLFTFDTATTGAVATQLVALNADIARRCYDRPTVLHVLGTNDAGQIAVLAQVLNSKGNVDTQIWRVTPTPGALSSTSYCMSPWRFFIPWP